MIFDSVKNACLYLGLNPRLDTALRFLADGKFAEQAAGRYVLQENDITCSRFTAETHPWEEGFFESHRKFFDIHVPLSSKELLLTAPSTAWFLTGILTKPRIAKSFMRSRQLYWH